MGNVMNKFSCISKYDIFGMFIELLDRWVDFDIGGAELNSNGR